MWSTDFDNNAMIRQKVMQEWLISMKKFSDELGLLMNEYVASYIV